MAYDNVPKAKNLIKNNQLRIGTMDAFFIDSLCGEFVTDYNSASRTSLFNIHTLNWDEDLCELFNIPTECLPKVIDSTGIIGYTKVRDKNIPITAVIIDQFAGVYGHGCRSIGDAKVTFGTGTFAQSLTGHNIYQFDEGGLLPTLCWKFPNQKPVYGLDGGVYNAASALNWVKSLGLFNDFNELDNFSQQSAISKGLVFVPALSGLACPYWDRSAAGLWSGLSLETSKKDLLQSTLEGIALRSAQVILAMDKLSPLGDTISIDGGLSKNSYFKQFLSNILNKQLISPANSEVTAIGTALLSRKGFGVTGNINFNTDSEIIRPFNIDRNEILSTYADIVSRSIGLRKIKEL